MYIDIKKSILFITILGLAPLALASNRAPLTKSVRDAAAQDSSLTNSAKNAQIKRARTNLNIEQSMQDAERKPEARSGRKIYPRS